MYDLVMMASGGRKMQLVVMRWFQLMAAVLPRPVQSHSRTIERRRYGIALVYIGLVGYVVGIYSMYVPDQRVCRAVQSNHHNGTSV